MQHCKVKSLAITSREQSDAFAITNRFISSLQTNSHPSDILEAKREAYQPESFLRHQPSSVNSTRISFVLFYLNFHQSYSINIESINKVLKKLSTK